MKLVKELMGLGCLGAADDISHLLHNPKLAEAETPVLYLHISSFVWVLEFQSSIRAVSRFGFVGLILRFGFCVI